MLKKIDLIKKIDKLIKLKAQFSGKLNNKKFMSGAPEAVVKKEQDKLATVKKALKEMESQLEKISLL